MTPPVAGDDGVLLPHAGLDAHANGLLAGAQVTEPTDRLLFVQGGGGCLKAPDKNELYIFDQRYHMASHLMVVMSLKYLSASSLETEVESAGPWSRMCSFGGLRSKVASETEELSRLLPPNRND